MSTEDGGIIILRENVGRPALVEEVLHHNQKMLYGEEYFLRNRNALEVEAQIELLEIGEAEGWSTAEMDRIREAKIEWENKLKSESNGASSTSGTGN